METKIGKIFGILFAFVMLLGVASATLTTSPATFPELNHTSGSFTFNLTNTENETVNISISPIDSIIFTINPSNFELNSTSRQVIVGYNIPSGFNFELGKSYSTNLIIDGSVSPSISREVSFKESDFCGSVSNRGNLDIRKLEFSVEGFGDEDDFWYLMDQIEVEVRIDNDGNADIQNVEVEWELYTTSGELISDGDISNFDLDEGDDNIIIISFKLNENIRDFEDEDAIFYIRATGEIDKGTYEGESTCISESRRVDVITNDDFMIAEEITINGNPVERGDLFSDSVACGSTVEISGSVFNIGDRDLEDSYVEIYNKEFGLLERVNFNEVRAFRSDDFSFSFSVPKDAQEKTYQLGLSVYDEDNDIYENSEDDESITNIYFKVEGNCAITPPTLTAELITEEVVEGKEVIIQVYLRNEDLKTATFTLIAEGYNSWATLQEINPPTFTLESGESKEVLISLKLNKDSAGEKQFNLVATSNGQVVINKPVILAVEEGSSWDSIFGNINFKNWNWQLIGMVVLNIILLVVIIIVARQVLRKR